MHGYFIVPCIVSESSSTELHDNRKKTRMWGNAQRDGRPAEYRWRPLFNTAKFGWRPLLKCVASSPSCSDCWLPGQPSGRGFSETGDKSIHLRGGLTGTTTSPWMINCYHSQTEQRTRRWTFQTFLQHTHADIINRHAITQQTGSSETADCARAVRGGDSK